MVELRNTIAIDASPEAVWEVLGDLGATNEWLPGIVAARMEGTTRICTTADGFDIREEISDYEPKPERAARSSCSSPPSTPPTAPRRHSSAR
jgi:uncharacterized protein YndB with AHSA1/START domain